MLENEQLRKNIIPVGIAGLIDRLVLHPVDTIASVQQHSDLTMYKTINNIYKDRGFSGFYAGLFWPLITSVPFRISIYSTYFMVKDFANKHNWDPKAAMLAGGVLSGFLETTIICPVDSYRTLKACQVNIAPQHINIKRLFRGYTPLLFRTTTENTIALAGSDLLLKMLPKNLQDNALSTYITGTISGAFSQFVITPIDLIKTKVMTDTGTHKKSIPTHIKETYNLGGVSGFFKSAPSKMLRMGVGNGLILGTIATVRDIIGNFNKH